MTSHPPGRSRGLQLTTASRVAFLGGVLLALLAFYFYWVPISVPTGTGTFGCRSAAYPPSDPFAAGFCASVVDGYRFRALMTAVAALVLLVAGPLLFARRVAAADPGH